jgi:hypothetical protein
MTTSPIKPERLREDASRAGLPGDRDALLAAADEIERLQALVNRQREAGEQQQKYIASLQEYVKALPGMMMRERRRS